MKNIGQDVLYEPIALRAGFLSPSEHIIPNPEIIIGVGISFYSHSLRTVNSITHILIQAMPLDRNLEKWKIELV